jgi:hypothetical protein
MTTNFLCTTFQQETIFVFKLYLIGYLNKIKPKDTEIPVLCVGLVEFPTPENGTCLWYDYGWNGRIDYVISKTDENFRVGKYFMSVSGWDYWNERAEDITFEITAATALRKYLFLNFRKYIVSRWTTSTSCFKSW